MSVSRASGGPLVAWRHERLFGTTPSFPPGSVLPWVAEVGGGDSRRSPRGDSPRRRRPARPGAAPAVPADWTPATPTRATDTAGAPALSLVPRSTHHRASRRLPDSALESRDGGGKI